MEDVSSKHGSITKSPVFKIPTASVGDYVS